MSTARNSQRGVAIRARQLSRLALNVSLDWRLSGAFNVCDIRAHRDAPRGSCGEHCFARRRRRPAVGGPRLEPHLLRRLKFGPITAPSAPICRQSTRGRWRRAVRGWWHAPCRSAPENFRPAGARAHVRFEHGAGVPLDDGLVSARKSLCWRPITLIGNSLGNSCSFGSVISPALRRVARVLVKAVHPVEQGRACRSPPLRRRGS